MQTRSAKRRRRMLHAHSVSVSILIIQRWWRKFRNCVPVNDTDPFSLEPVQLDVSLFRCVDPVAGKVYLFEAWPLYCYMVSEGKFLNPYTRHEFTRPELIRIQRITDCGDIFLIKKQAVKRNRENEDLRELVELFEEDTLDVQSDMLLLLPLERTHPLPVYMRACMQATQILLPEWFENMVRIQERDPHRYIEMLKKFLDDMHIVQQTGLTWQHRQLSGIIRTGAFELATQRGNASQESVPRTLDGGIGAINNIVDYIGEVSHQTPLLESIRRNPIVSPLRPVIVHPVVLTHLTYPRYPVENSGIEEEEEKLDGADTSATSMSFDAMLEGVDDDMRVVDDGCPLTIHDWLAEGSIGSLNSTAGVVEIGQRIRDILDPAPVSIRHSYL
jgi:hypothetical protein